MFSVQYAIFLISGDNNAQLSKTGRKRGILQKLTTRPYCAHRLQSTFRSLPRQRRHRQSKHPWQFHVFHRNRNGSGDHKFRKRSGIFINQFRFFFKLLIFQICHLEDGAHFGEIALVMQDELRVASVIAVEVCELYRLDRKDFVRAIHPYPDLLDNIQRIAADRMEKTTMLDEHNRREMASKGL